MSLAAAALVLLCIAGVLGLAGLRTFASRGSNDERFLDEKAVPASVTAPVATEAGETKATEPARNPNHFEITVQPDQTLHDISVQYLGGFDLQRLHQIQALNQKLTDPDHIEVGQKSGSLGAASASGND